MAGNIHDADPLAESPPDPSAGMLEPIDVPIDAPPDVAVEMGDWKKKANKDAKASFKNTNKAKSTSSESEAAPQEDVATQAVPDAQPPDPMTGGNAEVISPEVLQEYNNIFTPEIKREADYEERQKQAQSNAVKSPPDPSEYIGLQAGPEMTIQVENSLTTPMDMTPSLLRRLSPFMMQLEAPLVYGEDGGFLNKGGNQINVSSFDAAQRGARGYESARSALAQSALSVGINSNVTSADAFVSVNSQSAPAYGGSAESNPTDNLGEPAIADLMTAADIAWQLSTMLNAPPLVLLINPTSMEVSYTKVQQFQDRTRYGFLFHAWGEEQPKVTFTAKCGAFISGGKGVQYASKRDSRAWQNLMNAFHFYKNNGYIYDTIGKSNAHHFIGAMSIHYDQMVYYGNMESFGWGYEEGNQLGGVEFSIDFTVTAMLDTAQQKFVVTPMKSPIPSLSDPRYAGIESRAKNPPGEFSVGVDTSGLTFTTQGHDVTVGEAFNSTVGGAFYPDAPQPGGTGATKTGTKGFISPPASEDRDVSQATASSTTKPFGLR